MILKSYSKINLTLKVNSKNNNGLHEIQSLYSLINLHDKIKVKKIKKNKDKISFDGPFAKFVHHKNNSIYQLLKVLRKFELISSYYSIKVTKNIPIFGGLGGGTSNAAFILKYLLKDRINDNLLTKLEKIIGTDLRLFFKKQGYLKNLKTIIELKKNQRLYFLLIQPSIRCSTKEIYSKVKNCKPKEQFNINRINSKNKLLNYLKKNKNDLQFIVEKKYPSIKRLLKDIDSDKGSYFARMTGSGSVCYGLYKDPVLAKRAYNKLKIKYPKFWFSFAKTV